MNINNIQRLIDILNESPGITELAVTAPDGAKIAVRRSTGMTSPSSELATLPAEQDDLEEEEGGELAPAPPGGPQLHTIPATMVGIFHSATPPLGQGASVSPGQIVGYIESMKLMNEIVAGHGGTVSEVLIDENLPVEYGQPLFRLSGRGVNDQPALS